MVQTIVCATQPKNCKLSIAGIQNSEADPFAEDYPDEQCDLTHGDIAHYVDADDRDNDDRPDSGGVMRLSEAHPESFWAYFDRFVRYWPR